MTGMTKIGLGTTILLLLSVPTGLNAQQTASLSGRVIDPQRNVIPGAVVNATLKSTSMRRATTTNKEGLYVLSNLVPGEYEIHATMKGFAPKVFPSVELHVGQASTMDIPLTIGDGQQTVVLVEREQAPLINTSSSAVDGVVTARTIESTPLNGRNFLELALLMPGNSPAPNFDPTKTNTIVISSAGQLGRGGSITIDGADDNDDVVGGSLQNISQDAVQEFQIATNRFSAGDRKIRLIRHQCRHQVRRQQAAWIHFLLSARQSPAGAPRNVRPRQCRASV